MPGLWSYLLVAICLVYGLGANNTTTVTPGQCEKPSASNWSITSNDTEHFYIGVVVTVTCEPGYRPSSANITCVKLSGLPQWNETVQCIRQCEKPSASNWSIASNDTHYYDVGVVLMVTCEPGYRPSSANIICVELNGLPQWNETVQCIKQCEKPSASNWSIASNETDYFDVGVVVMVTCEPGYRPSSANIICVELNGLPQWNETVQCIRQCEKPSASNWSIASNETDYFDVGVVIMVTCEPGYRPSSANITCVEVNGLPQWNEPVLCIRQCDKPSVSNWSIASNDTDYFDIGVVVMVTCEPGYRPSPANITCVEINGLPQWNETVQCIRLCGQPTAKNLNITNHIKDYYDIGDVVTVSCDTGYRPSSNTIVCQNPNGTLQWNVTDLCLGQCGKPSTSNLFITSVHKEYYDIDDVVTVRCDPGYRPSSTNITCVNPNGLPQWNEAVRCIRQCGKPSTSNLSNTTSDDKEYYDIDDMVTVRCEPGYRPSSTTITCVDHNGLPQWNETVRCIRLCYQPAEKNMNTTVLVKTYDIGDVFTVICNTGYRPSPNTIVCENHNGTLQWNVIALCLAQCKKPQISNMTTLPVNKEYYNVNESIEVKCVDGYRPSDKKMTCVTNGDKVEWDRTPQCIAKCKKPQISKMVNITKGKEYYRDNESVEVKCEEGYWPTHENMTCRKTGDGDEWDRTPQCIAQCKKPEIINMSTSVDKEYYSVSESVEVKCEKGYWPSHKKMTCVRNGDESKWDRFSQCIGLTMTDWKVTSTSISFKILCTPQCRPHWRFTASCELMLENYTSCGNLHNKTNMAFTELQPFSMYRINTTLQINNKSFPQETIEIMTNESVPDSPIIKQMPTMENNTIRWEMSDIRGKVTGFQMNISVWRDYNASFIMDESMWFLHNVTEYKIPLQHGTNYSVTLRGFTSAGAGNVTTLRTETEIGEPPCHMEKVINNSILQLFPVDDLYGPISSYEIIVLGGQERNLSTDCKSFENIHYNSSRTSRYYTAAVLSAQNLTRSRTFILGDNEHYNGFYNAPLVSKHTYTIYIRVNSQWKQVNKSSCAFAGFLEVAEPEGNTVPIIAGSISAVILLLVLLILVVVWRSRSSRKSNRSSDIQLKPQIGPGKKKDIPVDNLLDVVRRFRVVETADTNDDDENSAILCVGRYQEYQELPNGWMYPCTVALSQENQAKNRYKKVLPYDDSRVVLRSSHSRSDYINASYIDGYKAPKFYIATQGPIPDTVSDFWSMVWQENSSVIVMLTGLEEQNKVKCERYWPEQSQTYGDITVSVQKIVQTGVFTIRSFSLKKVQSTVQMMVEQIHYLRWPDHGVPKKPSDMVQLVEIMNKCNPPGSGPVIVHCSAGIGRTGTFLALDILLKRAHAMKKVNVYNCVLELRKKRVKMVQEKEQYIFLYDVLLETLLCGSTSVPVAEIQKHACCMYVENPTTHRNGFDKEFQALEKITQLYQIYPCKEGKKLENQTKNRTSDILPGDHWRPILLSSLTRYGAPGYINAVFVNSNSQDDALIVTQLPMKHTLADFWALAWDYRCTAVVMMQREQDLQKHGRHALSQCKGPAGHSAVTIQAMECDFHDWLIVVLNRSNGARFWPEKGETTYGAFKVRTTESNPGNGYTASTLNLRRSKGPSEDSLEVRLLQLDSWPLDRSLPENPAALISLVEEAEKCQQRSSGSRILVTCCDGAGRSGLFCAGVVICDQIRSDGCLDVSQAVRSLRKRRYQFIPNVEQYTFCYALAQSYLDSFETYGNFK